MFAIAELRISAFLLLLYVHDALANSANDQFSAAVDAESSHDVRTVSVHGPHADVKLFGDLAAAGATRDELHDLSLPFGNKGLPHLLIGL